LTCAAIAIDEVQENDVPDTYEGSLWIDDQATLKPEGRLILLGSPNDDVRRAAAQAAFRLEQLHYESDQEVVVTGTGALLGKRPLVWMDSIRLQGEGSELHDMIRRIVPVARKSRAKTSRRNTARTKSAKSATPNAGRTKPKKSPKKAAAKKAATKKAVKRTARKRAAKKTPKGKRP
jgi:hypothetical protein